jgi:uncharacterized protein YmfQ (DUF2313 family)
MAINKQAFSVKSQSENIQALANLLPTGKAWTAKNITGTNLRNTLKALSIEIARSQSTLESLCDGYIPNFTTSFIEEWENELGIPDDCFSNTGTDAERRRNIIIKLAHMNLQTSQDYLNLADLLGLTIAITPISEKAKFTFTFPEVLGTYENQNFEYTFPIIMVEDANPFTFVIDIDTSSCTPFGPLGYQFDFPLCGDNVSLFICLIDKLRPAHLRVIYQIKEVI